jgi:hypothetical protein
MLSRQWCIDSHLYVARSCGVEVQTFRRSSRRFRCEGLNGREPLVKMH